MGALPPMRSISAEISRCFRATRSKGNNRGRAPLMYGGQVAYGRSPMRSEKDVEAYLGRLNRKFSQADAPPGAGTTFLIHSGERFPPVALRVDPPLVVLRVHIGDVNAKSDGEVYRQLLQHNARSLVHTSFGL